MVRQCGLVGGQRTTEEVKLLCITKGREFEGGRIERREEEKSKWNKLIGGQRDFEIQRG